MVSTSIRRAGAKGELTYRYDDSLVFWLPLRQLSGTTIVSRDRVKHSCTVTGTTLTTLGRNFNGTTDVIDIPYNAALNITSAITIMVYAKPSSFPGEDCFIVSRSPASGASYTLEAYLGNASFYLDGAGGWYRPGASCPITQDIWTHVTATYDGATKAIYINGVPKASSNQTGAITSQTSALAVGNRPAGAIPYAGLLDDVRIYNRALKPAEIARIYEATRGNYS